MTMSAVANLKRNDFEGALKIAQKHFEDDTFGPELAEQLLMLQDKPDKLLDELLKLEREMT